MVTWLSLGFAALLIVGLVLIAGGLLATFAGMMSDSQEAGSEVSSQGCGAALIGGILIALSIWGLVS